MEFTKFGLDGAIIKSASSRMKDTTKENYTIIVDLKPALNESKLDSRIQKDFKKYNNKLHLLICRSQEIFSSLFQLL